MRTHVGLLRGVNVGGRTALAMSDLREVVTALGFSDVATHIRSGNVVFGCAERDCTRLATTLERAIAERTVVRPGVVVLSRAALRQVVAANPYSQETDPTRLHVVFHREQLGPGTVAAVAAAEQRARSTGSRDEATVIGSCLYLRTPDGLGRSAVAAELNRAPTATTADVVNTMRNWATVTRLVALLA